MGRALKQTALISLLSKNSPDSNQKGKKNQMLLFCPSSSQEKTPHLEGQAAQVLWQLQSHDEKKSGMSKNMHGILHNFEVQVAYPFVSHTKSCASNRLLLKIKVILLLPFFILFYNFFSQWVRKSGVINCFPWNFPKQSLMATSQQKT